MNKRPFTSTAILTFVGRSAGFLVPLLIAHLFGANAQTDAFFFAYTLIFFLINIPSHIFESSLVPYLTERAERPSDALALGRHVLSLALPTLLVFSALLGWGMPWYLQCFNGWSVTSSHLLRQLYFEMVPFMVLSLLISYHTGFFYASKSFWFPALSPILRSGVSILFLFFSYGSLGIHAATYGFVIGEMMRWVFSHHFIQRCEFFVKAKKKTIQTKIAGSGFFSEALWQTIYILLINGTALMDQTFLTRVESGTLSLFSYADRLLLVPYSLFINAVIQIFLSYWSEAYFRQSRQAFWKRIKRDSRTVLFIAMGLAFLIYFLRFSFTRVLFHWSDLSENQIFLFATILGWLALGFPGGVLRIVYGRVFFVMKQSRFLAGYMTVEFLCKIALNYYLFLKFGALGIAVSTAIIYNVSAICLYFYMKYVERSKPRLWAKEISFEPLNLENA